MKAYGQATTWRFLDNRCKQISRMRLLYNDKRNIMTAILFQSLPIEQGTLIRNAKFVFTTEADNNNFGYDIKINAMKTNPYHASIEDIDDSSCAFRNSLTDSQILWPGPHQALALGVTHETPDLKEIIQEIVNLSEWLAGNDVIIVFHNDELPNEDYSSLNRFLFELESATLQIEA